jgi:SOS-response transcriptional repressor LexA
LKPADSRMKPIPAKPEEVEAAGVVTGLLRNFRER